MTSAGPKVRGGVGWVGRCVGRGTDGRQTCGAEVLIGGTNGFSGGGWADVRALHGTCVSLMTPQCDYSG